MKILHLLRGCWKSKLFIRKGDISKKKMDMDFRIFKKYKKLTRKLAKSKKKKTGLVLPPVSRSICVTKEYTKNPMDVIRLLNSNEKSIALNMLKQETTDPILKSNWIKLAEQKSMTPLELDNTIKILSEHQIIKPDATNADKFDIITSKENTSEIMKELSKFVI